MSFVDLGGDGAHEVEVPLEPVLDATHYKTTTLADLDDFDPALLFASLPQPYRTISKVLEGIWEESWAKIEERHPEVVVSLGGQARAPPRDLENLAVARAVVAPGAETTCVRWRGAGGDAAVLVAGTATGSLLLYEPTAPREAEDDGGAKRDAGRRVHRCTAAVDGAMPDGDVDRKMERISEEQAVEWRAEYDKDLADVGRPTFALPAPERPTRVARLPADPGAKAPSRPATPAPAEGDELDEEPPVEVPTFHFVGCYSAAEGCATDASVVELASWALPAAATASAVAVDARRGADEHAVLALGLATGAVLLWDLHLDLCRRVLKRHQAPVTSIAVHRHKYLVAGAGDGRLHVYDLAVPGEARAASGAFVATEPALVACRADLAAPVTKVLCLDVAALAVAADGKGSLALYDLANDGVLGCLSLGDGQAPRSDGDHAVAAGDDCVVATSAADGRVHVFAAHHLILQLCPGVNAAAGGERPLTILRLFSNPDGGPGDFAAEPPSPPLARQLPGGAFIDTYDLLQDAVADSVNGRAARESTLASILKSMQKAGGSS
ncbi:hypothetical protein JL720_12586 [Aureococcus anophagefferens]|nr:hypothetical protein JL720_12586 [Aureococcus anophagefferens]